MEDYRVKNGEKLRCGFTTGTCATAAAAAAAQALLTGVQPVKIRALLPNSNSAVLEVERCQFGNRQAFCQVVKHAGDDPDVTDGIKIGALVSFAEEKKITISGGEGVGMVTEPGLQVPPGEPAINPAPRRMILENVQAVCKRHGYNGGLQIVISAEGGAEIAKKTFNPRLGIVGGISILGTTGIVEPMSERALVETIHVLIDKAKAINPIRVLLSPGNYGREYCLRHYAFDLEKSVKYSNYLGETLDYLVYRGFQEALLVGHIGKLVKVAAGVMNTHSAVADCRMETITAHAALAGAGQEVACKLMQCRTTDAALAVLEEAGLTQPVLQSILAKIQEHINARTHSAMQVEVILFATGDRVAIQTPGAAALAKRLEEQT